MVNRRKGVASSVEESPESTAVVLSKTGSSTPSTSASAGAAACHSGTESASGSWSSVPETDWKRAFQTLSRLLGREMISSDVFYLVGSALATECGSEAAKELLSQARKTRSSFTHDFMG